MSFAPVFENSVWGAGDALDEHRTLKQSPARFVADDAANLARDAGYQSPLRDAPDPMAGETRWPAWKVSVAVIAFCSVSWAAIAYIGAQLVG